LNFVTTVFMGGPPDAVLYHSGAPDEPAIFCERHQWFEVPLSCGGFSGETAAYREDPLKVALPHPAKNGFRGSSVMRLVLLLANGGRKRRRRWDTQSMIRRPKIGVRGTWVDWAGHRGGGPVAEASEIIKPAEDELLTFVRRCFQWRNADVFALGERDSLSRLGEIAGYLYMLADKNGEQRVRRIRILVPPPGERDAEAIRTALQEGVRRAYRRLSDSDRARAFADKAFDDLQLLDIANFTGEALVEQLSQAGDREVVIVGEASQYRFAGVAVARAKPALVEDVWCAHLHELMLAAEAAARANGSYVVLDIAQLLPAQEANLQLLKSAGDVGLVGGSVPMEMTAEEIIGKVTALSASSARGDIGEALALIEGDERLSGRQKWALRIEMLHQAGLHEQVRELLDASAHVLVALPDDATLAIARIAAAADRDDLAQQLLERVLPRLLSEGDLENALRVALATHRRPIIARVRASLEQLHPRSDLLRLHNAEEAAREGNHALAATLFEGAAAADHRKLAPMHAHLAEAIASPGFAEPLTLAAELAGQMPERASSIYHELMLSLERAGRRDDAVALLFSDGFGWNERWLVIARGLIERALTAGSKAVDEARVGKLIDIAFAHIAAHPAHGYARTSIADLLDPTRMGASGLALLLFKVLERAARQVKLRARPPVPERQGLADIRALPRIIHDVLDWLQAEGKGVIISGRHIVPRDRLKADPDAVLAALLTSVATHAPDPADPLDATVMQHFVTVATAVAPLAAEPDEDLSVLRGAAIRLALGGRPQLARDLAEQALILAGDRPARRRQALYSFADIYARLGMMREALLALGAAFEASDTVSWDEVWHEQNLLFRLVRDIGIPEHALRIVARLREALAALGMADSYGSRVDTFELQARDMIRRSGASDATLIEPLLAAATANANAVLEAQDELLPVTMLLRQLVNDAGKAGLAIAPDTRDALDTLVERLPPAYRAIVTAAAGVPELADVAAVAGRIEPARYSDDTSYDLRMVRTMARRLARSAVANSDPKAFIYAVEALSVQGLAARGAEGELAVPERLLGAEDAPLAAATEVAKLGLPLLGMAMDQDGLMISLIGPDGPQPPAAVPAEVFARDALDGWSRTFPYGYAVEALDDTGFRAATQRLGLPALPERALLLAGELTRLPPNVLTVDGDLAGSTRALATTPSLAWLRASIDAGRRGDGSAAAWIPIASDLSDTATLSLLKDDVEDVLAGAGVPLHTQAYPPVALAKADLAILGAHGGLAEENRFFRSVSDDRHEPADLRQLADALRGSRVAILFVCSGGRLDLHPESGGPVGMAHRLLGYGLEAVIAPSWPIEFLAARPWLKAFLDAWKGGAPLIDACHAGNLAVAKASSYNLKRALAMTLHGNPFLTCA
jgi:hypothetical protein